MSMKIYLLWQEYQQTLIAACSTPEKAEMLKAKTFEPENSTVIEEIEIDAYPREYDDGLTHYRIKMNKTGNHELDIIEFPFWIKPGYDFKIGSMGIELVNILWARDSDEAIARTHELREKLVIAGEWGERT